MPQKAFALSAKVLIRDKAGRILLLKRSMNSKHNKGKWDLPGGKVDKGEAFEKALLREVVEETGLSIELECVAGAAQSELPERIVAYLILEANLLDGTVCVSDEHETAAWVDSFDLHKMDICEQFCLVINDYASRQKTGSR